LLSVSPRLRADERRCQVRRASIPMATCTTPSDPVAPTNRAYGKTVWSWPSLLRSSSCGGGSRVNRRGAGEFREVREARTNSAPGRARHKPSDHRAGKAVCWASPVCCCAVLPACAFRAADRGCRRHPAFPAPFWLHEGDKTKQSSGEISRENGKTCLVSPSLKTTSAHLAPSLRLTFVREIAELKVSVILVQQKPRLWIAIFARYLGRPARGF